MSSVLEGLSQTWLTIQGTLLPWLKEELGELKEKQQRLITTLEVVRYVRRPASDHITIASAFVAKSFYKHGNHAGYLSTCRKHGLSATDAMCMVFKDELHEFSRIDSLR